LIWINWPAANQKETAGFLMGESASRLLLPDRFLPDKTKTSSSTS
jgi:hypothetical protein